MISCAAGNPGEELNKVNFGLYREDLS